MKALLRRRVAILLVLGLVACRSEDPSPAGPEPTAKATTAKGKVEIIAAPEGELAPIVKDALAKAKGDGKDLVVYAGAAWCEPCLRFHEAALAGELDATFPTLRILELDLDRDADRMARAGYTPKLVPLFARPNPDGTASGLQVEGSVKGDRAVAAIVPRLRAMLDQP